MGGYSGGVVDAGEGKGRVLLVAVWGVGGRGEMRWVEWTSVLAALYVEFLTPVYIFSYVALFCPRSLLLLSRPFYEA